jgi:hypothetical protein
LQKNSNLEIQVTETMVLAFIEENATVHVLVAMATKRGP